MKTSCCLVVSSLFIALLLYGTGSALAENGRDFAGSYAVTNETDWGEDVSLTLSLRIVNYSGADVTDALLTLDDPLFLDEVYADLGVIDVAYRRQVVVSKDIVLPFEEYQRWREGQPPQVQLEYLTADGNPARRPVELMAMPLGEE